MNPDAALFHLFNNLVGVFPLFDWTVRALVNDYAVPTLFALVLGALWFVGADDEERRRYQRAVFFVLIGIALTNLSIRILQNYYFRSRPFASEPVQLLFYRPSVSSFPSVPVATMFCYVAAVWDANRRWGLALLGLAAAFALARVIAGVHYPSDLVGGALWGIICTWLPQHYSRLLEPAFNWVFRLGSRFNLA